MSDEDDLVDKLIAKDSWKEFDLITYSRRKESKGINKQTFTFSRNRENTTPYWVIGMLGGMAILLYFVLFAQGAAQGRFCEDLQFRVRGERGSQTPSAFCVGKVAHDGE